MAQITLNSTGIASSGALVLQSNGTTTAVTIDASQNVGVGTTSPAAKLDVQGTAAAAYVGQSLTNNSSTGYVQQALKVGTSGANGSGGTFYAPTIFYKIGVTGNDTTTPITFVNNNDTERARIDSSGNLLVGTTSQLSSARLSVSGTSNGVTAKVSVNSDSPFVGQNSSGTVTFNVTGNGQIITLEQTPVSASNVASNPGTAAIWDGSGNLYKQSSSMRYKENIAEWNVTNAQLDAFVNLNPKLWDYIGKENGCAGFIAEDIEALGLKNAYNTSPLINYSNEGQPDSNRDFALIALQHKVIQRLEATVKELKARLDAANL